MLRIFGTLFFCLLSQILWAKISLPDILADSMVLQQGVEVPVWGQATAGVNIQISFSGQTVQTKVGDDGQWKVVLRPLMASFDPQTMTIEGDGKKVLHGILVGEVWLFTGQSNMQWTLRQSTQGEKAVTEANHPNIRLFNVSREVSFGHEEGPIGQWASCSPVSANEFSAVGYYTGLSLQEALNVPVGLINASYGGSQIEAWVPRSYLQTSPDLIPTIEREKIWEAERPQAQARFDSAMVAWEEEVAKAKKEGKPAPRAPKPTDALREYRIAASIYRNMIKPLIPVAIRGVCWYQGESNEDRAEQYGLLLPVFIQSWRDQWDNPDLPFGIVQLPNFRSENPEPADEAWSHIRDEQRRTVARTDHTGLIVTIDLGEADDIHPRNKYDVGLRIARWALADVYQQDTLAGGPLYHDYKISGSSILVSFDRVGEGLCLSEGEELQEFSIAGADRSWHWAKAKIINKNHIEVWSPEVPKPVAVRYAFNNNPRNPDLTNNSYIPATPFRTDDWYGPTHGKR